MKLNFPQINGSLCCNAHLSPQPDEKPIIMEWADKGGYAISKTYGCSYCGKLHDIELWYSLQETQGD